ncbi:MAG TPA: phospholipase D-like domain-containing protein [Chitinophagaceae bacterium]|nr:phospholipase D-like domain-containing protein [Chitinophagaceae bacterium]
MSKKKIPKQLRGFTENNSAELIRGGKDYFEHVVKLIRGAKDTIHLQTYIFDDDETGTLVANALKEAAGRKVKVYLLLDGYASQGLSKSFIQDLKDAGIHFRYFQPLLRSKYFYFGRRLHQKVMVFDTFDAVVGGVNVANHYNDIEGEPAWLDFAVHIRGEAAQELCVVCWKSWKNFPKSMGLTPCETKPPDFKIPTSEKTKIRIRRNDWVRRKNQITGTYSQLFRNAKKEVTVLCSYFLPGRKIRRHIIAATRRGVKIRLILAGLSDVKTAKNAERYIYDWLLRNGISIYEYKKTILHGKLAVCDRDWMTIGSYNVNNLSAYASIELNLDLYNPSFAANAEDRLNKIIEKDCVSITAKKLKKSSNVFTRLKNWISYRLVQLSLFLFTFYFKERG